MKKKTWASDKDYEGSKLSNVETVWARAKELRPEWQKSDMHTSG